MQRKALFFILISLFALNFGLGQAQASNSAGLQPLAASPAGTAFTYQGQLVLDDAPVNSTCEFTFSLWDDPGAGKQIGSDVTLSNIAISDGLFTVSIDFGTDVFTGDARWLEIFVDCNILGQSATLWPRQPLTPAPYSIRSESAADADTLDGEYASAFADAGHMHSPNSISPQGEGSGLDADFLDGQDSSAFAGASHNHDNAYWSLTGNAGTTPGTDFLGTTDGQALELHVNGSRALRLEPDATSPNVLAGHPDNAVLDDAHGSVIGGGGNDSAYNRVYDNYGTVGGGRSNQAGSNDTNPDNAEHATVGGGEGNEASANRATVSGGAGNRANAEHATVAGGNASTASGQYATVGGGETHTASGDHATIAGGGANLAGGSNSSIGGGVFNEATGDVSTIGGGGSNEATASYATVGGGWLNLAQAKYSVIAGGGPADEGSPTTTNNVVYDDYGAIGGGGYNRAGSDDSNPVSAEYATVSGGGGNNATGAEATIGGGTANDATALGATVGGGHGNQATAQDTTVGGGWNNKVQAKYGVIAGGGPSDEGSTTTTNNVVYDNYGAIGGGGNNRTGSDDSNSTTAEFATVSGGEENEASAPHATVGGGSHNQAQAQYSVIAGGGPSDTGNPTTTNNVVYDNYGAIGGGGNNRAGSDDGDSFTDAYATVSGGYLNRATGSYAMIPGGYRNDADGHYSFAAGTQAKANNNGCFVWGDHSGGALECNTTNRTIFRSTGGYYIYTNLGLTSGMYMASGGSSWLGVSDRARKENLQAVDTQTLLENLADIEINTWNYKAQDPSIRHIGPMAQDFNALLPELGGEGEKYINTLDADGVALASIQGLYQLVQEQSSQIETLQQRIADLEALVMASEQTPDTDADTGAGQ